MQDKNSIILNQTSGFGVTQKYTPVKTQSLIETLQDKGYKVESVARTKVRKASKDGFQKHMVRLSHNDLVLRNVGDSRPEIVIVNSHDGLSSLKIMLGVYRLVCSNGMIVGKTFAGFNVRHVGDIQSQIDTGLAAIAAKLPEIASRIEAFNGIMLSQNEQLDFARRALSMVLPKADTINYSSALNLRRSGDAGNSLWVVYNRLQEAILRGGVQYTTAYQDDANKIVSIRHNTTRAVKSIDRQVELNQSLWDLASQYKAA